MTMLLIALVASAAAQPVAATAPPAPAMRAQTNLADYFSSSWYPPEALHNREEGGVRFQVDVRPNGRVEACRILASSGSRTLDEATCAIMVDRGRFTPARDAEGRAIADRFTARIQWALPAEAVEPAERARAFANLASYIWSNDYPSGALARMEQGTVGFNLDVSDEGRVTYCNVTASSGSEALDLTTCRIMLERARFEPARDAEGNPVPDRVAARISWRLQ